MTNSIKFKDFLSSISTPNSPVTVLSPGLRAAVEEIEFKVPPGYTMHFNHVGLFFTNPVEKGEFYETLLSHYRLFANEWFLNLETKLIEFRRKGRKAGYDENYLNVKKSQYLELIEKCLSADEAAYAQRLNKQDPEDGLGERFIQIELVYLLDHELNLEVGFIVKAMEVCLDGSAIPVAIIHSTR